MQNELDEILGPDRRLVDAVVESSQPERLRELFCARTRRWKYHLISGECFSVGLFSDLCSWLSPSQAFELIPAATDIALEQQHADLFATALGLLNDLSSRSDTAQMPLPLAERWPALKKRAEEAPDEPHRRSLWNELNRWYRCPQS